MKIGWWAEVSITPETFVFGTPNNHLPLIREAERRGHTVELIHVPWKVNGKYIVEQGEWAHLRRSPNDTTLLAAVHRRKNMEDIVKRNSGLDATMRTFRAAAEHCSESEPDELPYDVIFMKLPPPGFLRTKLEVVYNLWRFMRAGTPVFCFDGDLMWDQAIDWLCCDGSHPAKPDKIHARTPYRPRKTLPNWEHLPYFYDEREEMPIDEKDPLRWHRDLVYVGNDWKQEDSPRAAGLAKFYGRGNDAIYGRWTESNIDLTMIPKPIFFGPIPANDVRQRYASGKASVVLGLPAYYKVGLITQRYREIIQAGSLALIDAAYSIDDTSQMILPQYRVENFDDVKFWLDMARCERKTYIDHVEQQRWYARSSVQLKVGYWIDQLERIAKC